MVSCRDKALDLVGRRPHFRQELLQKLTDRGYPLADIEAVLDDLTRLGLLDDPRHAREMVSGSMTRKGFGPRRMRHELRRRGVDDSIADTAVSEVFDDPDEELRRARVFTEGKTIAGQTARDRLARQLDRKGYSAAVIIRVLGEIGFDQSG